MTDTQWTPGPWFWHGPVNANRMDYGVTAVGPYDPSVGAVRRIAWIGNGSGPRVQPDTEANARLIAAAPELYEALFDLIADEDSSAMFSSRMKAAQAAIAKARGEA